MSVSFPFSLAEIQEHLGAALVADSFVVHGAAALWLDGAEGGKRLAILGRAGDPLLARFQGAQERLRDGYVLKRCPTDHNNGRVLRATLPWLQPAPIGLSTSAALGTV